MDQDSRWPAHELCAEFVKAGLGAQSLALIERAHRVSKAAFSGADERPTARMHFESFMCASQIGPSQHITVVDDLITRGATMLAAVAVLQRAYPAATVRGFALIRTMSDVAIQNVTEPVEGRIVLRGDETFRRP
jgi:predicted amidophosphoribosyltransferase